MPTGSQQGRNINEADTVRKGLATAALQDGAASGKVASITNGELEFVSAGSGSQPAFDGCRYSMTADHLLFANLVRGYDTSNYSTVDESGLSTTDEIAMPRDGYYRITASARMSFAPGDPATVGVKVYIVSPERDGDWDVDDHFHIPHTSDALEGAAGLTVTHWLAETETVSLRLVNIGGGADPNPFSAALEVEFVGSGTNPVAP